MVRDLWNKKELKRQAFICCVVIACILLLTSACGKRTMPSTDAFVETSESLNEEDMTFMLANDMIEVENMSPYTGLSPELMDDSMLDNVYAFKFTNVSEQIIEHVTISFSNGRKEGTLELEMLLPGEPEHCPEQVFIHTGSGVIRIHLDLLGNNPALLLHALLGEIALGYKLEQGPEVLLKQRGAGEMIGRDVIAGKGIGACAGLRQLLEGVAVGHVKHLMLQIVGHAVGGYIGLAVQLEPCVYGAVIGGKEGIGPGKAALGYYLQSQAIGQRILKGPLAQVRKISLVHASASP